MTDLLIIVAVLAVLAVFAIGQVRRARLTAREELALQDLRAISHACQFYFQKRNDYPAALTDLGVPYSIPPYLEEALTQQTPVRHDYRFTYQHFNPQAFLVHAQPLKRAAAMRHFSLDQSGSIRAASGRPAMSGDPVIELTGDAPL